MGRTATEELELIAVEGGGSGPGEDWSPEGGPDGGAAVPQRIYVTGIWLALASMVMFFTALTSSYVVRQGLASDWVWFPLPPVLWANTAVLLLSSVTLERARRLLGRGLAGGFRRWWGLTTALGLAFLAGQLVAWRQLAEAGVYLATNPSSSFFYVMTGAHGLHLGGGLVALVWVGFGARSPEARASRMTATTATAVYWHFLGVLWLLLFLLLQLGR